MFTIPTFVRLKVKKLKLIDFMTSTVTVAATILIGFYYGDN
jgi:hypothetical protein